MSGYNYSDVLDDDGRQEQSGGALRKQLEEALGEIRSLRQELNESKRQDTVTALLEEKGIDPAVAQLMPKDANPSEWLEKYAGLFRSAKGETLGEKQEAQTAAQTQDSVPDAEKQAFQNLQGVQSTGQTSATEDPIAKMQSFQTQEELLAYLVENGMQAGGAGGGVFR